MTNGAPRTGGRELALQARHHLFHRRIRHPFDHARRDGRASAAMVAPIEAMNFALNEILLLATVALLGKPGFNQFKQIVSGVIG
jgi:hypothetical protein